MGIAVARQRLGRQMVQKRTARWAIGAGLGMAAAAAAVWAVDAWVNRRSEPKLFDDVEAIDHNRVGLLLGTRPYLANGQRNRYYQYRIDAAVALYQAGKIEVILVSGDYHSAEYNEPDSMRLDLMARGIPAEAIVADYAGFRTLDSLLRCQQVFGVDEVTVISQPFHNRRSVVIAEHHGIEAIAYNARDVSRRDGVRVQLREKLARVKMLWDLCTDRQPQRRRGRTEPPLPAKPAQPVDTVVATEPSTQSPDVH